jgi:hypothetical protein
MIKISGAYRIQSVYMAEKAAYLTIKDKADGSICKVAFELPLVKAIVDDALVQLDGVLLSRVYSNNVGLTFSGDVKSLEK